MLARKALAGTAGAPKEYVEDVFSTYLWDGNATARNIVNGIDLSGEGGMVWTKYRNTTNNHRLYDTARGATKEIYTSLTNAESTASQSLTAFNADGFSLGTGQPNENTATVVGWTFRKAKKFFDVVTYTGNGTARTISHNLGSVPGCIIVKRTDTTGAWQVYHRANTAAPETDYLVLNTDAATADSDTRWNDTLPTSTEFSLGTDATVNANSGTYVAYLFAHDAGGFGDAGSDSIIKCGSVVGASQVEVDLGWEPQWLLVKNTSASQDWWVVDNMRGLPVQNTSSAYNASALRPNLSDAETTGFSIAPSSTGFKANVLTSSQTYIYIAIRRGPMKTPTSGTSVFTPIARSGTGAAATVTGVSFPPDFVMSPARTNGYGTGVYDRLRGANKVLVTTGTAAEVGGIDGLMSFNMNGVSLGADSNQGYINASGVTYVNYFIGRAPGFFDVVCYTGTGSATTVTHNLGVAPELMIVKRRGTANAWAVYANNDNTDYLVLNTTAATVDDATYWNDTSPTSSVFSVGTNNATNASGSTYVAYLFASLTGISKVGSYTGNGSNQTINCGFTGGARFVLIKATSTTGNWVVFDSARGIVSGDDPYLLLNSTAAEVTNKDAVDTDSTGFVVNETTGPNVNTNGVSYIFWAVA